MAILLEVILLDMILLDMASTFRSESRDEVSSARYYGRMPAPLHHPFE
jgi:hypothetical protein